MNPEGSRVTGVGEEKERVVGLLREAASRLERARDPEGLVQSSLARGTDSLFSCDSPVGGVFVGMSELGARLLGRADDPEAFVRRYRERFGRLLSWGSDEATRRLARRVAAALAGERIEVPADLSRATPFQRKVLKVVSNIPRGEVRPYAWVAREAGSPRASRAVGTVMANNPVPLIVPCHRVVRNDGTTGGYAFGASEKIELLEGEGVPVEELVRAPYLATPTAGIFCHATCRNVRRIQSENRRRFRSAREAADAGYRPCGVCRPVVAG